MQFKNLWFQMMLLMIIHQQDIKEELTNLWVPLVSLSLLLRKNSRFAQLSLFPEISYFVIKFLPRHWALSLRASDNLELWNGLPNFAEALKYFSKVSPIETHLFGWKFKFWDMKKFEGMEKCHVKFHFALKTAIFEIAKWFVEIINTAHCTFQISKFTFHLILKYLCLFGLILRHENS